MKYDDIKKKLQNRECIVKGCHRHDCYVVYFLDEEQGWTHYYPICEHHFEQNIEIISHLRNAINRNDNRVISLRHSK